MGEWIEANLVVPDGYMAGQPFKLTDEMWTFLIHFYRVYPWAEPWPAPDTLQYTGAQLRRSQKWGKDPFGAADIWAEALGPTRFAGWATDERDDPRNYRWNGERIRPGDPIGAPYPTPLIVCLGTSEEQTDNTYRPLLAMARNGPLADTPDLDIGETRVILPSGGKIEPVTTSAKARLGAPLTFLTITESHLFALQGGYRKVCGAVKRNVAGMDGRWLELTNAYDPTEGSEAQVTAENPDDRVYVNTIEPRRVEDLNDDEALYAELLRQYGDSARECGGWVNIKGRIFGEARSPRHMEADRRRFFLNEVVVGEGVFVDPIRWDALRGEPGDMLRAGEQITVGFDGSKYQDATALIACRASDGHLFELRVWEKPADGLGTWRVPSVEVDRAVKATFEAYEVGYLFADPYRWQDYLDAWSALWPDRVVEFPTNVEQRMDKAIERFTTSFAAGEIKNDAADALTRHVKNAVLVKGSRKKPRPGEEEVIATHYMKMAKRGEGQLIDAAVAAVLAYAARGQAIEDNVFKSKISLSGRLFGRSED
ncbi:MAG TPA: hypothetical protein DGT23_18750 [Micromonosporaceae bacterium]|nr:hypothetical protein [Micromonosporaceae bacterium]